MRGNELARNLLAQEPGRGCRHANATDNPTIANGNGKRHGPFTTYFVTSGGGEQFPVRVNGRDRWALERLRAAGLEGCTAISQPAPRWSAYVFNLRELGIEIETVHEPHGGDYPGHHARYVLRSDVSVSSEGGAL